MGLLRRRSEAEKQLEIHCGSIASAFVQSADGSMPPDFVEFVIEGNQEEVRRLHAVVVDESGDKAAYKASIKHGRMVADVWARSRPVNSATTVRDVENLLRRLVG